MEFATFLLCGLVLILVLQQRSFLRESIRHVEYQIKHLQEMISELNSDNRVDPKAELKKPVNVVEAIVKPPIVIPEPELAPQILANDSIPPPKKETPVAPPVVRPSYQYVHVPAEPIAEPEESFFERHPDLEKFIGENLINKIGIAILVLSIGYFVKYAIDSNWIGELGRVAIGLACGGILIAFAHRMRTSYQAFSSVLVGGGLAVFYFTITLAFHQFQLFSQTTALLILIVITLFAVVLSLLYNRQELAIIALVGGFSSPFMLTTGTENYHGLLLYLLILNIGLLILAYYKSWRVLNITSFVLTVLVFAGVLSRLTAPTYYLGFIYASVFYLLYFLINIAYTVRASKSFIASDFSIILINTALYFSVGLYLLTEMGLEQYRGLFSVALGFVNLCFSYLLFKNKKVDSNILYLLIGITLTFVSLSAPIQLEGNHITLFWASEAVLLYWLYLKSKIKLVRITSLIILVAMTISLIIDWSSIYSTDSLLSILANKGFITTLFSAIATFLLSILVKRDAEETEDYRLTTLHNWLAITAITLLFLAGVLEVNHQFVTRYDIEYLNITYLTLYVTAFILLLNLVMDRLNSIYLNGTSKLLLYGTSVGIYFKCTRSFFDLQEELLNQTPALGHHFAAHWLTAILIFVTLYLITRLCWTELKDEVLTYGSWVLCATCVFVLSLELSLLSNALFYSATNTVREIERIYIKTGLPVIWGLSSFIIMLLGMKFKDRTLRIVSLSLFSLTLVKLFLFDIRDIPAAGKIAAFFCLGVLLLIVSFMYQKLKKIVTVDAQSPDL